MLSCKLESLFWKPKGNIWAFLKNQTDESKYFIALKPISENSTILFLHLPKTQHWIMWWRHLQESIPLCKTTNCNPWHTILIYRTPIQKPFSPWNQREWFHGVLWDRHLWNITVLEPQVSAADRHHPLCNTPGGKTPRQDACKPRAGLFLGNTCQVQ